MRAMFLGLASRAARALLTASVVTLMFIQVNSMCARQLRPPPGNLASPNGGLDPLARNAPEGMKREPIPRNRTVTA
jgi:hypothetical protein